MRRSIGSLSSSRDIGRWIFSYAPWQAALSALGAAWVVWSASALFFPNLAAWSVHHRVPILLYGALGAVLFGLLSTWPESKFKLSIQNRDVEVEVRVGSMFETEGDYVISSTTSFDVDVGDDRLVAADSLLGQFIHKFHVNSIPDLRSQIADSLSSNTWNPLPATWIGERRRFARGTVARVRAGHRYAYLLGIGDKNPHGNILDVTEEDVMMAIYHLWEYVTERGNYGVIVMGLIGTGRARVATNRERMFKQTVQSFVAASAAGRLCRRLVIAIPRADYADFHLDLRLMKHYVEAVSLTAELKPVGTQGEGQSL